MLTRASNGKILYAVAFMKRMRSRRTGRLFWKPGFIEYCHAADEVEARLTIVRTSLPSRIEVVAAAPAIGHFVNDNHGEKLSAS